MSIEVRAQNTISMTSVKAIKDATDRSAQLLATMEEYAEEAGTTLTGIYQDAEDAKAGAQSAKTSAETAISNLSQMQRVLDVVNWIALHGAYSKTTDTVINPNKTYYTVTATAVTTPVLEDLDTYYELVNGEYVKTTDTTIVAGKTYYVVTGTPVAIPTVTDIGTYYELYIDEAMSNYIQAHLLLTNDGLYVMADDSEWKVLVADDGVYIIDPNDEIVAQYKSTIQLGKPDETHLNIASDEIAFNKEVESGITVPPFRIEVSDQSGEIIKDEVLGSADRPAWEKSLAYTPIAGTEIRVQVGTAQGMTFTAGTAETISPLTYDGDRTFTKERTTSIVTVSYRAQYLIRAVDADLQIGTRTLQIGSQIYADNYPRYTIGNSMLSTRYNSLTVGAYNKLEGSGLFVVGNGTGFYSRSNAFVVKDTGDIVASGKATSGDVIATLDDYQTADTTDKAIYDAITALGWDSDVLVN